MSTISADLNQRIILRGRKIFAAIAGETPTLFSRSTWTGRVMQWCLQNEKFKTNLFQFVDVFPVLQTPDQVSAHLLDYFGEAEGLPPVLATGVRMAGKLGTRGSTLMAKAITANIHEMARQFILAENTAGLVNGLRELHKNGFGSIVDVLGEATLSHGEAAQYLNTYLNLLDVLVEEQHALSLHGKLAGTPVINLALKPTALYCLANPMDFEGSVAGILDPLRILTRRAEATGAFLCIDMESSRYKEITLEVYRRLKEEFPGYPHLGIALQSYLRDSARDLEELLAWAAKRHLQISIRLVKGAYWDSEIIKARQMGWPAPVFDRKADTDANFEKLANLILRRHEICHFACASHNIRSIAAVVELAKELGVPEDRYEFQMLYGMAEPVRRGILAETGRLRLYAPFGEMVPGMGYLVRRLLENTANNSFLRLAYADAAEVDALLADPLVVSQHENLKDDSVAVMSSGVFHNEPAPDFTQLAVRNAFPAAIAAVRTRLGRRVPLLIGGQDVVSEVDMASVNPNCPDEIVGRVCQAGVVEVEQAIAVAVSAFPAWRDKPVAERADVMRRAAALVRQRRFELAAWQILEIGKQWDQAYADVTETIDFLEYYAGEIQRIAEPRRLGALPGEQNLVIHEGRGVAAVIAPWNFPLAIAGGMVAAALVTGNTVVFKPSGLTGVTGRRLAEIFRDAGVPDGVFNFVPGRGSEIGDLLTCHPDIAQIVFTGSLEVGTRIVERAAILQPGQRQFRRVVAELGGKNAIIIDDDADFDEAIPQVLASAFGFQGQKCSACSRVIVLESICQRFCTRLVEAARAIRIGPSEDPSFAMGAVAEEAAQQRINKYIDIGSKEGRLLYASPVPSEKGFWVPLAMFVEIEPRHRLAQEEVFGPVLSIMKVKDIGQALEWANGTKYALTGGLFSRSPSNIALAQREFRVGNCYVNRAITGAMVGRQPFGGSAMSGLGTKAGGPDYLPHFLNSRIVTEHTMRRGFAPPVGFEAEN